MPLVLLLITALSTVSRPADSKEHQAIPGMGMPDYYFFILKENLFLSVKAPDALNTQQ
jgi:hypothetical protein